jgi:acyl-CoA synthetase (AMP-forming)/AMP-acid ligase II
MRPPLIYPQLPHLHNHGLAISSHAIWKEFLKAVFLLKYHQNPRVLKETEHRKKREKVLEREREREKERKRKALRVSSTKNGKSIFWEEKNIATSKSFLYEPIFFPSIIPFQKPFPKSFEKILQLFLDHPLTWQYTWLELYPLSLSMSSTYLAFRG